MLRRGEDDGLLGPPRWAIAGVLARSPRAGFPGHEVDKATVDAWLAHVKALGVQGILCLLSEEQLGYYDDLPGGLLGYYRHQGFTVEHIPIEDPAYSPLGHEQLRQNRERIWELFERLPKPVLVHCSAGIERTGYAVDLIEERLHRKGQAGPAQTPQGE